MRIVRFDSQERVDLPDMTAVSYLVLGEFRRELRELTLGADAGYIVRGFAVEPSAVPDARIRVRANTGVGRLGVFIGGENLGGGITAHGTLVGGNDDAGVIEGAAQQILDFAGQPANTYVVEMRFTYGTGANDNRAFWNQTLNTEFIAAQDTRNEPVWTARYVAAATGGEWIPLGSVVWNGVGPITTLEITDTRPFLFEGTTPYQGATQAAAGAFADFDRSHDRAANGVNEVYPVLRALGRQIQDIKGQSVAGNFDWYSRVFPPRDGLFQLPVEQTKSLRSVEATTYTLGDDYTSWGDFNGVTALEDCLQHLEDSGAAVPQHVLIVNKTHANVDVTFTVTTAHAFHANLEHLRIDMGGHPIAFSHPAGAASAVVVAGTLEVSRVKSTTNANNATLFEATKLIVEDCSITGDQSATAEPTIDGGAGSRVIGSTIIGLTRFTNPNTAAGGTGDILRPVECQDSAFLAVEVTARGAGNTSLPLLMRGCFVNQATSHCYGANGAVDLTNNSDCTIESSRILFLGEGGSGIHAVGVGAERPDNVRIHGCYFEQVGATTTTGEAAISFNLAHRGAIADCVINIAADDDVGGLHLLGGCTQWSVATSKFLGGGVARAAVTDSAIYLLGPASAVEEISITGCVFSDWDTSRCIYVASISERITVTGCQFVECDQAIDLSNFSCDQCSITGNTLVLAGAGVGFDLGTGTNGVCNSNQFEFGASPSVSINAAAAGDWICSGNRGHAAGGTANIVTGGATLWGFWDPGGPAGPVNLNFIN